MNHRRDFKRWERELSDTDTVDFFPPKKSRKYVPVLTAAGILTFSVLIGSQVSNAGTHAGEPQIADPATYRYYYGESAVTAVIPTPSSVDGGSSMRLEFSCDSNGSLIIDNASSGLHRKFTADDLAAMEHFGITDENPCINSLNPTDAKNLGSIAMRNGFATYNIPFQLTSNG